MQMQMLFSREPSEQLIGGIKVQNSRWRNKATWHSQQQHAPVQRRLMLSIGTANVSSVQAVQGSPSITARTSVKEDLNCHELLGLQHNGPGTQTGLGERMSISLS